MTALDKLGTSHNGGNSDLGSWWYMRFLDAARQQADKHAKKREYGKAAAVIAHVLDLRLWQFIHKEHAPAADLRHFPCCEARSDNRTVNEKPLPRNIFILNEVGYHLQRGGQAKQALPLLKWVIELDPERAVAHYNLGDALWDEGNKESAKTHYQRYVELRTQTGKSIPARVRKRLAE